MIQMYFYSHTPCGVQHEAASSGAGASQFLLTHPLRGATEKSIQAGVPKPFLLTHPLRGATAGIIPATPERKISTHTPLAGCNKKMAAGWMEES